MKKIFISLAALFAIVACSKNDALEVPSNMGDDLVFKASFEGADSRVSISEDGDGFKLAWSANDELAIYTRKTKTKYAYNPAEDVFTRVSNNVGPALTTNYYAVYPYTAASQSISDDGVAALELPSKQYYAEKSFGVGANTMVAACPKPAEASSTPISLEFMNVCGYLRLYLYGEDVVVKSIELRGNNGELLSGQVNTQIQEGVVPEITWVSTHGQSVVLDCGEGVELGATSDEATEFWFVLPPVSFEEGFKIRVTDIEGRVMQKVTENKVAVTRNVVESMSALPVEFPKVDESLLLDVQFNVDGTASDNGKYLFDIVTRPGAGLTVVDDEDYPYGKVAKFTNCDGLKNKQLTDSYYFIDYNATEDFKSRLTDEDGFTLEMVVKHGIQSRADEHPWQNPATSNTFGFFLKGTDNGGNAGWMVLRHSSNDDNSSPFNDATNMRFAPYMNQYYHYTYVYDKVNSKALMYCDGELINQLNDITSVATGKYFAIGGFPTSSTMIEHSFTGSVAMVRIYDSAITAEQAKAHYDALNIPSKAPAVGQPLFDAKFNADGTAENVGTANITIETVADAAVLTTQQRGEQYVANFHRATKNNSKAGTGFYYVDYSQNADYIDKLNDGYTMEVLCMVKNYPGDYWSKVMSITTAGIHHIRVDQNNAVWGVYGNTPVDNWGTGNGYGRPNNFLWGSDIIALDEYYHMVLVWDAESNVFTLYENGKYNHSSYASKNEANVGDRLAIGGLPCTDKTVYHPFVGEVAIARIYDEEMTHQQVIERYEELQPIIQALSSAQ